MADKVEVDTSKLRDENVKNYNRTEEQPESGQTKKWVN